MNSELYALVYREQILPIICDNSFFDLPEHTRKEKIVAHVQAQLEYEYNAIGHKDTFWHYSGPESKVELWGDDGIIDITFVDLSYI